MVTTIRPKEYILGSLKLKTRDFSAADWLEIIEVALKLCKPHLKYFPNYKSAKDLMTKKDSTNYMDCRTTDKSRMQFFADFDEESQCYSIFPFSHETEGDLPGHGVKFFSESYLLLTRKGQWVNWTAKYERKARYSSGSRRDEGIEEEAVFSRFSKLSSKDLLEVLEKYPKLGKRILIFLEKVARKGAEEKERLGEDLRKLERKIGDFLERTELDSEDYYVMSQ
jgi:hypothetical protein